VRAQGAGEAPERGALAEVENSEHKKVRRDEHRLLEERQGDEQRGERSQQPTRATPTQVLHVCVDAKDQPELEREVVERSRPPQERVQGERCEQEERQRQQHGLA
jgi:hypothetical protein